MAKEKLNVNSSNKKVKPSLKKLAFWGLLATTLLTWCWDWKKVWNWLDEKKSNPIEVVEKNKYEWKSIDGVEWIIVSENSNTKQLFLSDWKEKLTSDFDNIKNVVKDWKDLYFLWWNWWKYSLYKNWEAILSDFDDIDYRIVDWKVLLITENNWKKTVKRSDEILEENCNEAIFKNIEGDSNSWDCIYLEKWWKAKIFIDGKQYGPEISSLDIKNNPRCLQVSKCWDDYMIICDCRMNTHDRPNNTIIYKGKIMYTWLDRAIPNDVRKLKCYDKFGLWDRNVIVVKKWNGKEELYDTKLWKIWTEYDYWSLQWLRR